MTQVTVNPIELANLLWNVVTASNGPAVLPGYGHILLLIEGQALTAYGMGRYTAGRGTITLANSAEEASGCITREEAEALQSALRKTSSAKDAIVFLNINEEGSVMEMQDEEGNVFSELVNISVVFKEELLAALPDSDPDGIGSTFWDHIDEVLDDETKPHEGPVTFSATSLKSITALKPPVKIVDLASAGNPRITVAKCDGFNILLGTTDRDLCESELWDKEES